MIAPRINAIVQYAMPDRDSLLASYMPHISGGGLFVPSKQSVSIGQELLVVASLPEQSIKYPINGKVIWISPVQSGTKPQGFAIQLNGEKGLAFRNEAERMLAGLIYGDHQSFTM